MKILCIFGVKYSFMVVGHMKTSTMRSFTYVLVSLYLCSFDQCMLSFCVASIVIF